MRNCFDNQDEVKTKGEKALEDSKVLSWDKAAEKLLEVNKKCQTE